MRRRVAVAVEWSGLLAIVLGGLGLAGCRKAEPPQEFPPAQVQVTYPIEAEVNDYLYFNGTTRGQKQTEVRPRVSGYLEKVNLRADTQVKEGDLLFTIDQRQYKVAVQRAEADLLGKKAEVTRATSDVNRVKKLASQQAASDQELIDRQASFDLAKANVGVAEAALADAKLNLDYTEIRAPINGRVSRNLVDEGTLLENNKTLLATIVNDDIIHVYFNVSETEYLDYQRKNPRIRTTDAFTMPPVIVDLAMSDEPTYSHRGQVISGDNTVDSTTATYQVRAAFENPQKLLSPGLFVRVRTFTGTAKSLMIPDVAMQADERGQFVYVVEKNKDGAEVAMRRSIETGPQVGKLRRVVSGLGVEDGVIVNGLMMVQPEAPVVPTVVPAPALPSTQPATQPATQASTQVSIQASTTQSAV